MTDTIASSAAPKAPAPAPAAPQTSYPPLVGSQRLIGTIALSAATFMNVLDSSIANVSIPAISGDLGVAASQGTWVITSFAVSNAIAVPLTGWLTQRFGQVRLFVASIILFIIASWLCGLAPNLESLIAFRVLQGLVAGPMIPLSQTLMLSSYPKAKAGLALALWAMTTLTAPVAGPLLGGWISDNFSWPWIFYINIPIGLIAAWASWMIFRKRETPTRKLPIDTVGLALLVVWVSTLQIMLDKGKELDWFASGEIVALGLTAFISFVFFLIWELTEKHPVIDLRLFAGRNFTSGVIAISVAYGVVFGNIVLMPLWLQTQMGYTATWAGVVTAPVGILAIILSPFVGKALATRDPRAIVSMAFLIFSLVSFMRAGFNTEVDLRTLMIPTVIQGAAMAMFFVPLVSITLSGLPPEKIPSASGLSNFVRITAGAFGTSIATTQWENRAAVHHATLSEVTNPGNPITEQALAGMRAAGQSIEQSYAMLERMVTTQAMTMGALDIFHASSIIFLLLIPMVWIAKRERKGGAPSAEAAAAH